MNKVTAESVFEELEQEFDDMNSSLREADDYCDDADRQLNDASSSISSAQSALDDSKDEIKQARRSCDKVMELMKRVLVECYQLQTDMSKLNLQANRVTSPDGAVIGMFVNFEDLTRVMGNHAQTRLYLYKALEAIGAADMVVGPAETTGEAPESETVVSQPDTSGTAA